MDYKIDYDAEYWDVVGNRKFTCYSEEDARWLCNFLNVEELESVRNSYNELNNRFAEYLRTANQSNEEKDKEITSLNEILSQKMELLVKANEEVERLKGLVRGQAYSIWKGCGTDLNFDDWNKEFENNL